ncbi:MAG: T9SS type A sorting domain-containing protein [Bacteroidetes bacterium]|nr:T9SS type A sorting domain-containing protein [Bacteroidota bacterium]
MRKLFLAVFISIVGFALAQCPDNNTYWLDLTPTGVGNTQSSYCTSFGEYNTVSVCNGATYSISTCNSGSIGNMALTIYNNTSGAFIAFQNSNNCSNQQETMTYTATFTGVIRILCDRGAGTACNGDNGNCIEMDVTQLTAGTSSSAPICPTISAPANSGTVSCFSKITFSWTPGSVSGCGGGTPTSYSLSYGTNTGGTNILNNVNIGNVTTYTVGPLAASTTYYWKIVGVNASGASTGCSTYSFFTPSACTSQDCNSGITICNSNTVPGNASGYGTQELTSTNHGCLSGNEHQSSWYAFSPATSGNLGLTITPGGSIDYDWAIWGPYASGSTLGGLCPPAGAPIRCSYASGGTTNSATGSYNTGMGNSSWESGPVYDAPTTVNTDGTSPDASLNGWTRGIAATAGQVYIMVIDNFTSDGTPYVLNWNLAGGATLNCTTLGFQLIAFSGYNHEHINTLDWTTISEDASEYFSVERSADGKDFSSIGKVAGAGSSVTKKYYSFDDKAPQEGINYYRLAQPNKKGGMTYSNAISLQNDGDVKVSVYPNPNDGAKIHLTLRTSVSGQVSVDIKDIYGNQLAGNQYDVHANEEFNTEIINEPKFDRGIYFLEIIDTDGKRVIKKIIVE